MVSRRTHARIQLLISSAVLGLSLALWRYLWQHEADWDDPIPLSPVAFALGLLTQGVYWWAKDRDVGQIRTRRARALLAGLWFVGWERTVRRRSSDARVAGYNFGVGRLTGATLYRLWYGLLRPVPGNEHRE